MSPNSMTFLFNVGHTESSLTQIGELEAEVSQLQSLNAKLEGDLLAAERSGSRLSKAGNGHDPDGTSQNGMGNLSGQGDLSEPRLPM